MSLLRQFSAQEEDQVQLSSMGIHFDSDILVSESGHSHDEKGEGKFYRLEEGQQTKQELPDEAKDEDCEERQSYRSRTTRSYLRSTEAYICQCMTTPLFQYQPYEVRVHNTVKGKYKGPVIL